MLGSTFGRLDGCSLRGVSVKDGAQAGLFVATIDADWASSDENEVAGLVFNVNDYQGHFFIDFDITIEPD